MTSSPQTYDAWLALSENERKRIHLEVWNTSERDGIAVAYCAASRLALSSKRKVLDISIGTYHGGEYVLHMTVSSEEFEDCPSMFQDEFEGFRVVWLLDS